MTVGNQGRSSEGSAAIGSSSGGSSNVLPPQPAYHAADTFRVTHPVRVKAGGSTGGTIAMIPPFWLNIRYSGIEAEELEGIRRMKMVTRCRSAREYEDYVLREYLVYRIYNLVTPYSFRVRLVRLKIIDTGRKNRETEEWAFLIEPEEMMARRLDASVIKSDDLCHEVDEQGCYGQAGNIPVHDRKRGLFGGRKAQSEDPDHVRREPIGIYSGTLRF